MDATITEESFIDFKCPECGELASFPQDHAGRAEECPSCSACVIVPKDGSAVGRKLPLPLTTPRLVLRRLRGLDWKDLMEILSDDEVLHYVDLRPLTEEEIIRWLEGDGYVKLTTPNQAFCLGIELREGAKLIGYITLTFTDPRRRQAALGIFLNRGFHRKGFATEALAALLDFCFREINLHRVTATSDSRNLAACRLFEKAGLRREGEFRRDRFSNGEWVNTLFYAILSEDVRQPAEPKSG